MSISLVARQITNLGSALSLSEPPSIDSSPLRQLLLQHGVEGVTQLRWPCAGIRIDAEHLSHLKHGALFLQHKCVCLVIDNRRGRGSGRI